MLHNSLMHNKFALLGDDSKVGMHEWSVGLVVHVELESTGVTQVQLDCVSKKGAKQESTGLTQVQLDYDSKKGAPLYRGRSSSPKGDHVNPHRLTRWW